MSSKLSRAPCPAQIGDEAGEWLQRLGTEHDVDDPIPDPLERQRMFLSWLGQSPTHVRVFFEIMRVERRVLQVDPQLLAGLQERSGLRAQGGKRRVRRWYWGLAAIAATIVVTVAAPALYTSFFAARTYVTAIGEQRLIELDDGSRVVLNTNSRVTIARAGRQRRVALVGGEALFDIRHDPSRPFVVNTGGANIRVLGTQFNVRLREREAQIAVVEGVVEVAVVEDGMRAAVLAAPATTRLIAGEGARVAGGQVTREQHPNIENAVLWRSRRLRFADAPLSEVVAEFNRYNRTQIRVVGSAASEKQLSGVFDADRPAAVIGYAMRDRSLVVEHENDTWVIRDR